jgi:hypothetical protein
MITKVLKVSLFYILMNNLGKDIIIMLIKFVNVINTGRRTNIFDVRIMILDKSNRLEL